MNYSPSKEAHATSLAIFGRINLKTSTKVLRCFQEGFAYRQHVAIVAKK